jgi:hypothetical protein
MPARNISSIGYQRVICDQVRQPFNVFTLRGYQSGLPQIDSRKETKHLLRTCAPQTPRVLDANSASHTAQQRRSLPVPNRLNCLRTHIFSNRTAGAR